MRRSGNMPTPTNDEDAMAYVKFWIITNFNSKNPFGSPAYCHLACDNRQGICLAEQLATNFYRSAFQVQTQTLAKVWCGEPPHIYVGSYIHVKIDHPDKK